MSEITKDKVVEFLSQLPVIEIAGLVKELEDKWGVSAAPIAAPGVGGGEVAEPVAEQTEFDVILLSGGEKSIGSIKIVREVTGKGLKESKDVVGEASGGNPQVVLESRSKDEALALVKRFEEVGAKAEIK